MLLTEFSFFVLCSLVLSKLINVARIVWGQASSLYRFVCTYITDWFSGVYCFFSGIKQWLESNYRLRLCEVVLFISFVVVIAIILDEWLGLSACFHSCSTTRRPSFQFGYRRNNGPAVWKQHFEWAQGLMQSPINIVVGDTTPVRGGPLCWKNHREVPISMILHNDGYSIAVSGVWAKGKPQITGEAVENVRYEFNRLYFHWGPTNTEGSEHTLDYERFALELHMIYLKEGYNTPMDAHYDQSPRGILIVAYLFEITPIDNPGFLNTVIENLPKVEKPRTQCQIEPFALNDIFPEFYYSFFLYDGSITQPPCSEIVTYIIQRETIAVSKRQMSMFRKLKALDGKPMLNNSRPVQKLNNRPVYYYDI